MGVDLNLFILNRPFLDHLKDFSQIFAKPDISFFCGGTLNHFLVVGKHSICTEVATFLFVRPFGVLRYLCIISPSRTFRSTPPRLPHTCFVLKCFEWIYWYPAYLHGTHIPTRGFTHDIHGSWLYFSNHPGQGCQGTLTHSHPVQRLGVGPAGYIDPQNTDFTTSIHILCSFLNWIDRFEMFWIVQAPDSNTWSHDGYTKKLDQIVPNITLYCQYMPISYHQWTYNKIQKITSTIENDRNTMTQHQSKPGDHFRPDLRRHRLQHNSCLRIWTDLSNDRGAVENERVCLWRKHGKIGKTSNEKLIGNIL